MSPAQPFARKRPRRPAGCEGHLTRRQAAALLGFASEFKIRELERQGLLRSVRGAMRTAFYPRADVLALKAQLGPSERTTSDEWTDADLLALLALPGPTGGPRTALDLVTETRISIDRAERVYWFWATGAAPARPPASPPIRPACPTPSPPAPRRESPAGAAPSERRAENRLERDSLIRELRDPDPRVRQQAFARLRDTRSSAVG